MALREVNLEVAKRTVHIEGRSVVRWLRRCFARQAVGELLRRRGCIDRHCLSVDIEPLRTALTPDSQRPMCRIVARSLDICVFRVSVRLWQAESSLLPPKSDLMSIYADSQVENVQGHSGAVDRCFGCGVRPADRKWDIRHGTTPAETYPSIGDGRYNV